MTLCLTNVLDDEWNLPPAPLKWLQFHRTYFEKCCSIVFYKQMCFSFKCFFPSFCDIRFFPRLWISRFQHGHTFSIYISNLLSFSSPLNCPHFCSPPFLLCSVHGFSPLSRFYLCLYSNGSWMFSPWEAAAQWYGSYWLGKNPNPTSTY